MNENTALQNRIAHNKTKIIEALKAAGITSATAEYTGEGDSGNGCDTTLMPAVKDFPKVTVKTASSEFIDGKWKSSEVEKPMDVDDAIREFVDDLIELHNHSGYENGDGGGGTVTFNVDTDSFTYEHYDNIVEQEYSYHEG